MTGGLQDCAQQNRGGSFAVGSGNGENGNLRQPIRSSISDQTGIFRDTAACKTGAVFGTPGLVTTSSVFGGKACSMVTFSA